MERLQELNLNDDKMDDESEDVQPTRGRRGKGRLYKSRRRKKAKPVLKENTCNDAIEWWRIYLDVGRRPAARSHRPHGATARSGVQPIGDGRRKQTPINHAGAREPPQRRAELARKEKAAKRAGATASLYSTSTFSAWACLPGGGGTVGGSVFATWVTNSCASCGGAIHAWCVRAVARQCAVM